MDGTLVHPLQQPSGESTHAEIQMKNALSRFELISSSASEALYDTNCPTGKMEPKSSGLVVAPAANHVGLCGGA